MISKKKDFKVTYKLEENVIIKDYENLIEEDWFEALSWNEFLKEDYMTNLMFFIDALYSKKNITLHPKNKEEIFRPFKELSMSDIKVVMITGEQPLKNSSGIGFGVRGIGIYDKHNPKEHEAIFKNISSPYDHTLMNWVDWGVLPLSMSLIYNETENKNYAHFFKKFLREIINNISIFNTKVIFAFIEEEHSLLFKDLIDTNYHKILICDKKENFLEDINKLILKFGKTEPIKW